MFLSPCLRLARTQGIPPHLSRVRKAFAGQKTAAFSPSLSQACPVHFSSREDDQKSRKDNILTVPNALCMFRICVSPYLAHLIGNNELDLAMGLFVAAGITDLADGWIARNFRGQASMLGSFLDPLADKILVSTLYLSLTYVNLIPVELTSLVVSRDVLLIYAGFYIRYMGVPPPFTLKKYFNISMPSAQVQPTTISKINTMVQLCLVGGALLAPKFDMIDSTAFHGLCVLTASTTFASAVSYAFMRDTYKFAHRAYDHQFGKKLTAFIVFILFNAGFVYWMPRRSENARSSPGSE